LQISRRSSDDDDDAACEAAWDLKKRAAAAQARTSTTMKDRGGKKKQEELADQLLNLGAAMRGRGSGGLSGKTPLYVKAAQFGVSWSKHGQKNAAQNSKKQKIDADCSGESSTSSQLDLFKCRTVDCDGVAFVKGDVCGECESVPRICPACKCKKAFQGMICPDCEVRRKRRLEELDKR